MNHIGLLREIRDSELELMRFWRNAPSVRANMYTQHEIGADEHLLWWEKTKFRADQKYFMYELNGVPTGISSFNGINVQAKNSAWAFYVSPTAPKGSGSKMEFLMLDYAFYHLLLHKLYCEVLAFNEAVIKLHQKFNFEIEGVFKDQYKVKDQFVDVYRLGLLATEWKKHRAVMADKLTVSINYINEPSNLNCR